MRLMVLRDRAASGVAYKAGKLSERVLVVLLVGVTITPTRVLAAGVSDFYRGAELGGVTQVLRYTVAQPDRSETDYLLLRRVKDDRALPEKVQVLAEGGEEVRLADVQGADCVLARVWIRTRRQGGPQIVQAQRIFLGDLTADVQSQPAVMQVRVFRPTAGKQPGDSALQFRLVGSPLKTRAVCRVSDVDREMRRLRGKVGEARR